MNTRPLAASWQRKSAEPVAAPRAPADSSTSLRPVAVAARAAGGDVSPRRRWSSLQLLGDQHEIEIAHADSVYRLRVTALGKLILTK